MGGNDEQAEKEDGHAPEGSAVVEHRESGGELRSDIHQEPSADELGEYIFHLRKAAIPWSRISEMVRERYQKEITVNYAAQLYRDFNVSLAQAYGTDDREQLIRLENERLDDMQQALWPEVLAGDHHAANTVIKVMQHRAKINGLDQIDLRDQNVQAQVLVVGANQRDWIEALSQHHQVTSGTLDDGSEREEQAYE